MMILSVFSLHSGPEEPRVVTRIVSNDENVKSRRLKLGEEEEKKKRKLRSKRIVH